MGNQVALFMQHLSKKGSLVIRACVQEGDSIFIFCKGFQFKPLSEMTLLRARVLCFLEVGLILIADICQILEKKKKENHHPVVSPSLPHFLKENPFFLSCFDNSHLKNASCF